MSFAIYVIVVTYNGEKWIQACLSSIKASSIPLMAIVIDNGSKDNTCATIKRDFPEVSLIEPGKNLGFGKANNLGIQKAMKEGADYVFLLNQDAWLGHKTIERLVTVHSKSAGYGVLSPIHLNGSGDGLDYWFSLYVSPESCEGFYSDQCVKKEEDKIYPTPFINAAGWLVSRSCIELVGGFNPSFFHYGEDVNYTERLRYHGLKLGVVNNCWIYHDREGRSPNPRFEQEISLYERSVLLKVSDPFSQHKFHTFYLRAFMRLVFSILALNGKAVSLSIKKLMILRRLNTGEIIANRELSLEKGAHFLKNT